MVEGVMHLSQMTDAGLTPVAPLHPAFSIRNVMIKAFWEKGSEMAISPYFVVDMK